MDELDLTLDEAWNRMAHCLRDDRLHAALRDARRRSPMLQRPVRDWCLCIRASDTRITAHNTIIERPADDDGDAANAELAELADRGAQRLTLTGETIRGLTRPVRIAYPGVDLLEAAATLGRDPCTLRGWIRHGVLQIWREYSRPHGYRSKPKPIVWSRAALDPNFHQGRPPDPVWGTLWQSMSDGLPNEYAVTALRVPSMRRWRGKTVQRGWSFICPGRTRNVIDANGEARLVHQPCGRRVGRLYGPQSIWTLTEAIGLDALPAMDDPVRATGPRSFACHYCWRVRYVSLRDAKGWNQFVTYVSGGLLYGHEVRRPATHAHRDRRRRYAPQQVPRPAPGRDAVWQMLQRGADAAAIARARRITRGTVLRHMRTLRTMHGSIECAEPARAAAG